MGMDTSKKVILGTLWTCVERVSSQCLGVVVMVILARLLEPKHYGLVAIVSTFIGSMGFLTTGGMGHALVQKKEAIDKDFDTVATFSIIMSALLYVGLCCLAPMLSEMYEVNITLIIRVMGIQLILTSINTVLMAYAQRYMMFSLMCKVTIITAIISSMVGIFMAYKGFGVWALILQGISSTIMSVFMLYASIPWRYHIRIDKKSLCDLVSFGSNLMLSSVIYMVDNNFTTYLTSKYSGIVGLAFYQQGKRYSATILETVVHSVNRVLYPVFSEMQDNRNKMVNGLSHTMELCSFLFLPIGIGLASVSENLVHVFLGAKWLQVIPFLQIFAIGELWFFCLAIFSTVLLSLGHPRIHTSLAVVSSGLNILSCIISLVIYGNLIMYAWSFVVVSTILTVCYIAILRKDIGYGFRKFFNDYIVNFCISGIMGICVYCIGQIYMSRGILLIVQVFSGIVIYSLLASIFRRDLFEESLSIAKYLIDRILLGRKMYES